MAVVAEADRDVTLMARETSEGPLAVSRMLARNRETLSRVGERLRSRPPAIVVTCARGSSDNAATYAKYLIETMTGTPTASAAPSIASLYDAPVITRGERLCLAISQSGKSPDLLRTVEREKEAGAYVVALVNVEGSPLAELADAVIALEAGPERSVAATKSFICSLAAVAALVAEWSADAVLAEAVGNLPQKLKMALRCDWSAAYESLRGADNLFAIARGYGLAVAQEAALKFKETCALHAECFSAAEVRHGPMAIVGTGFRVFAFAGEGLAGESVRETVEDFRSRGAEVWLADTVAEDGVLPAVAGHPAIEPIVMIQSFYRLANAVALARGCDPDSPPHLRKVTETL